MASHDTTYYTYRTPHGHITIGSRAGRISAVVLGETALPGTRRPAEITNLCANELLEYFAGKRTTFDLPLLIEGSDFQKSVWAAALSIPYGQTRTNAEIAAAIGRPSAFRMVGGAVRRNPLAVLVPAHRIVGANGKASGNDRNAHLRNAFLQLEKHYA